VIAIAIQETGSSNKEAHETAIRYLERNKGLAEKMDDNLHDLQCGAQRLVHF
jgi:hypothetical protein